MKNFLFFGLLCCCSIAYSQSSFTYPSDSIPTVNIIGTSTLHDWKVQAGEVADFPSMIALELEEGTTIDSFGFSVKVMSLDGGRGASMNGKIQKALQAATNPTIQYQQTEVATLVKKEGVWMLISNGVLSMAGAEKEISVEVTVEEQNDQLLFAGSKPLKMSDFNITPPSAMFGQIQTDDAITVQFEFRYYKD